MSVFDLYGFKSTTLEDAKDVIADILMVRLEEHESSYWGGVYFVHGQMGQENFKLVRNLDLTGNEPLEPEFRDHHVLLFVNASHRSDALKARFVAVPNMSFLRRNVVR